MGYSERNLCEMIQIDEDPTAFTFSHQPHRQFDILQPDGDYRALLEKWGLLPDTELLCFRFDQLYHRGMKEAFLKSLFQSEALRATMRLANGKGDVTQAFASTSASHASTVAKVEFEELLCTKVSLDIFDCLLDNRIVRRPLPTVEPDAQDEKNHRRDEDDDTVESSGTAAAPEERIVQMMDVYLPCGITVADQLRGLFMLGEESEFYGEYFSDEDKKEFLYHVMWRLCAGGSLNQWEDNFVTLKDAARTLYKDLVCVGRSTDDDEDGAESSLKVLSHVMLITDISGVPLFPRDDQCVPSNGNYCYVVVNPSRKEVLVWYHAFWSTF
jgi:cilia- and flagella-associated protein 300